MLNLGTIVIFSFECSQFCEACLAQVSRAAGISASVMFAKVCKKTGDKNGFQPAITPQFNKLF